jgi:hypothetical protein
VGEEISRSIAVPREFYDDLREEYRRMRSKAPSNPWLTFEEFAAIALRLGAKRFAELASKNLLGLTEFLKFLEREMT